MRILKEKLAECTNKEDLRRLLSDMIAPDVIKIS